MTPVEPSLTDNAKSVLAKRYLIRNEQQEPIETPAGLFKRVSDAIASVEIGPHEQMKWSRVYYQMMAMRDFEPNTPCLVNAGRPNGTGQLSACFVLPVPDSMSGIFESIKQMAMVHKTGGGTGFSFSRLRPAGDFVSATSGIASGPISFMQLHNNATEVIKQGGVRRGANMGILRVDHPDIIEFIRLKLDPAKMQNFNVSVAITDAFMDALANGNAYDLINPATGKVTGSLEANLVWELIISCAWRIGDPGLVFIDRINDADPLAHNKQYEIEATNPCGEVPLCPFNACTLGSINLANFYDNNGIDYDRLRTTVTNAVRFLDSVLSINRYPVQEIADVTAATRKIGLGVMGWADLLIKLGIPYASDEARGMGGEIMRMINTWAVDASEDLAIERGPFPAWGLSKWKDNGKQERRNATVTVIAPTGTISIIAGCSSGIEPLYALSMTRAQANMTMLEVNPLVEEVAKREGFYSEELAAHVRQTGSLQAAPGVPDRWRRVFMTANEIDVGAHIRMQSAFQKHTEDAVSKTINLAKTATLDDVESAYMTAWGNGCKGITVYRDGCRDGQVLTAGVVAKNVEVLKAANPVPAVRRRIPENRRRKGETLSHDTSYGTLHVTVNEHPDDNEPFEVFVRIGKSGSEVMAWTEAFGRATSYLLSIPSPITPRARLDAIAQQMSSIGGAQSHGFGEDATTSAPDALAKVMFAYLFGSGPTSAPTETPTVRRDICPSCGGATLTFEQRCGTCSKCGFSKC